MSNTSVEKQFINGALKKFEPNFHEYRPETELVVEKIEENVSKVENEAMREAAKAKYFSPFNAEKKRTKIKSVMKQGTFFG